jgi:G3E family GTPase
MDHILLETTGLADPAPLVSILWLDEQLESSIRLDSIITVSNSSVFLVSSFFNSHFMRRRKFYW